MRVKDRRYAVVVPCFIATIAVVTIGLAAGMAPSSRDSGIVSDRSAGVGSTEADVSPVTERVATTGPTGGGGRPDSDLASVLNGLPRIPDRTRDEPQLFSRASRTGIGIVETREPPEAALQFYRSELIADGWRPTSAGTRSVRSDAKADGTTITALILEFERDGLKLTVAAAENPLKNPEQFQTQVALRLTRGSDVTG